MRTGVRAVLVFALLLALGGGVAYGLGQVLAITAEPTEQMAPDPPTVPAVGPVAANPRLVVDAPDTVRLGVALDELTAAQDDAGTTGTATLGVTVRDGAADDDTYRLTGTAAALRIEGASEAGAVRGVYDLAAAARSGRDLTERLGETVTSRLPFRMVDLGAVGVTADPAQWRDGDDYSHVSRAFEDAYLPEAPYVDQAALAGDYEEWDAFLRHVVANGANAVAWPGFVEYADLPEAGSQDRAAALRAAFTPFWERAAELGVEVFLRTDMLALTPALADHLDAEFGTDTTDPELWQVYTDALDRLYADVPALSGVLIRVGEGGSIYAEPGWDYYSALEVTTVDAVRTMLEAFTAQAERSGREVVFRTWSVGIGAVGDMHTDPASYAAVLDGLDSPALVVSTKYTAGDFYSWLPLNTTLESGQQRRIVEFQSRREFEGFGSFPNDLGPELAWSLRTLLAANPRIEGVWTWTQDGGPWRAGPMTLYLQSGFWPLYEHETLVAAALARDPDADVAQVTVDWARRYLSQDPATVTAIAQAMALSREAVRHGLYLEPFAAQRVTALGLEPPPQMWLFEWDILTGDSATLSSIYRVVAADGVDTAIADAEQAVRTAEEMRDLVAATDPDTWRSPDDRAAFVETLDYETDVLRLLAAYRATFLLAARWHDTGEGYAAWRDARDRFDDVAAAHLAAYDDDVLHPAWNLEAADLGLERADRDHAMVWAARVLLLLLLAWLVLALRSPTARAGWTAAVLPWRTRDAVAGLTNPQRLVAVGVPLALLLLTRGVQTWFLAPAHLLVTLGALAVATAVTALVARSPWVVLTVVAGVGLLRSALVLLALVRTGPGGYWAALWTEPGWRAAYVTLAVALFAWGSVALAWALPRRRGAVLAGAGVGLAASALLVAVHGLEASLTVWNDQLALLPWGLARILGITTYLEIPGAAAWWVAAAGGVLATLGMASTTRRPARSPS